jgi:hypothetical protein
MITGRIGSWRILYLMQSEVDDLAEGKPCAWVPPWALGLPIVRLDFSSVFVPDGYTHLVAKEEK